MEGSTDLEAITSGGKRGTKKENRQSGGGLLVVIYHPLVVRETRVSLSASIPTFSSLRPRTTPSSATPFTSTYSFSDGGARGNRYLGTFADE